MERFQPQVISPPNCYLYRTDCPLYLDNLEFVTDSEEQTRVRVMVPKSYMGMLIGHRGKQIKHVSRKFHIHVQTWQEGTVVVDRQTYSLPVMWGIPLPSFVFHGRSDEVHKAIDFLYDSMMRKSHLQNKKTKNGLLGHNTHTLYKKQCAKNIRNHSDVIRSLPQDQLISQLCERLSEYVDQEQVYASYIVDSLSIDAICRMMNDSDVMVSMITDITDALRFDTSLDYQFCLRNLEKQKYADQCKERGQEVRKLTFDEQYEGEKFIVEQELVMNMDG
ncbi:hypothetical protein CL622_04210 [archaeon]|nr:hypothetical protein [archaeon]|tara:strand:- start:298 stop:1125 length:828 start_codon:yes stop_codon:yes gene_type:complete